MPENQNSALPTNKMTTMMVGTPTIGTLLGPALLEVWPQIAPAWLVGPSVTALIVTGVPTLLSAAIAYFIRDKYNG